MAVTLTATPSSTAKGRAVQLAYTGGLGGSLRVTRPDGSRSYLPTAPGSGSKTYTPTVTGSFKADLFTSRKPLRVIASAGFAVTVAVPVPPPPPVTPPPPASAVRIAVEDGSFVASGGTIWYGANAIWASKAFPAGTAVTCSNATFGDPVPNVRKECRAVVPAGELEAVAGDGLVDLSWTP